MKELLTQYRHLCNTIDLPCLWLINPVQLENRRDNRISIHDKIRIDNGKLVSVANDKLANAQILGCFGNFIDGYHIEVKDLENLSTYTVKI